MEKLLKSQVQACYDVLKFVLNAVLKENRPADKAIAYYFKNHKKYGSRDRRLMYEVVFSVFRWYGWVKELIDNKFEKEIIYSKIENHSLAKIALVSGLLDGSVEKRLLDFWVKELNFKIQPDKNTEISLHAANKLINKILESFNITKKILISDLIPNWAYHKIKTDFPEVETLIESYQTRPPIWIRVQSTNIEKLVNEFKQNEIQFSFNKNISNAICIKKAGVNLYSLDSFKDGLFEIQDIASQVIGLITNAKVGERWWDCCAGAGGKSLQLSTMMENKGRIIASDIREYKLDDLKKRAKRNGKSNIECKAWDGKPLRKKKVESFDGVLVDAPCSCSGTWRRNPDAKWRLNLKELDELISIQSKILENASSALKKGGTLIYATCSIFKEENSQIVNNFLSKHSNFTLEKFTNPLDGTLTDGMLQIFPWSADCDAMFVAKLKRI